VKQTNNYRKIDTITMMGMMIIVTTIVIIIIRTIITIINNYSLKSR